MSIKISTLRNHVETIPTLATLLHESICKIWSPTDSIEEIQSWFNDWTNDHIPLAFVALDANKPVGMCSLQLNDGIRPDLKPWLGDLCVDPSYRNKGIGSKLIEIASERVKSQGYGNLYLFTPDMKAVTYYKKRGWQSIDTDVYHGCPVTVMHINLI